MTIYTRTGDGGETSLFGGGRVGKAHPRVEAYGSVDELNSVVGWAIGSVDDGMTGARLRSIQHDLFVLGADQDVEWVVAQIAQQRLAALAFRGYRHGAAEHSGRQPPKASRCNTSTARGRILACRSCRIRPTRTPIPFMALRYIIPT